MTNLKNLKTKARYIMQAELAEDITLNSTQLAEIAAIELDHDNWLDDPNHWIWHIALSVNKERPQ